MQLTQARDGTPPMSTEKIFAADGIEVQAPAARPRKAYDKAEETSYRRLRGLGKLDYCSSWRPEGVRLGESAGAHADAPRRHPARSLLYGPCTPEIYA
jgi:hypothetical protein